MKVEEQAGFHAVRSTINYIVSLTQAIEKMTVAGNKNTCISLEIMKVVESLYESPVFDVSKDLKQVRCLWPTLFKVHVEGTL